MFAYISHFEFWKPLGGGLGDHFGTILDPFGDLEAQRRLQVGLKGVNDGAQRFVQACGVPGVKNRRFWGPRGVGGKVWMAFGGFWAGPPPPAPSP